MIRIDQKMTVWEGFELPDSMKEAFELFLSENPFADYYDIYNWACENGEDPHAEMIEGTQEYLTPDDNGGASTLEIIINDKTIFGQ